MLRMRRGYLVVGIALVLLAGLATPPQRASAGWARGDASYFEEERVCRDGLVISAITTDTSEPEKGKQTPLSVRYYDTSTFTPLLANDADGQRPELYGPLLAPPRIIQLGYHPNAPLSIDWDDDGVNDYDATIYTRNITVKWPRLLNVGDRVVIRGGTLATWTAVVTSCVLNRMTTLKGGRTPIDSNRLMPADASVPPADLVYQVDTLPAHGTLLLNGAPLAVGGFFTQADINANRLDYDHNGDTSTSDSFKFSVSATFRVSVPTGGGQATGGASTQAVISGDGEHIAFTSAATNLVAGDTNNVTDVFRHDLVTRQTTRLSVSQAGVQGNAASSMPAIALDGNTVAFQTTATNLVNSERDEFGTLYCGKVKDTNKLMDIYVNYRNDPNHPQSIYRASLATRDFGSTCDEPTGGASLNPAIESEGDYIAYESDATNLVEDDTNGKRDVFGITGEDTVRLSMAGEPGDEVEVDGRSQAVNIGLPTEYPDRRKTANAYASDAPDLVAGDTNGQMDIFVRDFIFSSEPIRISKSSAGAQAVGGPSTAPSVSAGGRFVAFESKATNLVGGDTNTVSDIFVHDRDTDDDGEPDEPGAIATIRVSVRTGGTQANGASTGAAISADGRYIAFESAATNLVAGDTNGTPDIFVYDRTTKQTTRVSVSGRGVQMSGSGGCACRLSISGDGSLVSFTSTATNLVSGDTNAQADVFVHYRGFSSTFAISIAKPTNRVFAPAVVSN